MITAFYNPHHLKKPPVHTIKVYPVHWSLISVLSDFVQIICWEVFKSIFKNSHILKSTLSPTVSFNLSITIKCCSLKAMNPFKPSLDTCRYDGGTFVLNWDIVKVKFKEVQRKFIVFELCCSCTMWMKVRVLGYKDREMTVGAKLWGITCTVKGKRTRLWRSWTGKKPGGACGLVGYRLFSTFLCSRQHNNREQQHFNTLAWETLTHLFKDNKDSELNMK